MIVEWIWSPDYGSGMKEKQRDDKEEGEREESEWETEKDRERWETMNEREKLDMNKILI